MFAAQVFDLEIVALAHLRMNSFIIVTMLHLVLMNVEVMVQGSLFHLVKAMVVIKLVIKLLKFVHMDPGVLVEPFFMSMRRVRHNQMQVWFLFLVVHHNIVVISGFHIMHDYLMVAMRILTVTRVGFFSLRKL